MCVSIPIDTYEYNIQANNQTMNRIENEGEDDDVEEEEKRENERKNNNEQSHHYCLIIMRGRTMKFTDKTSNKYIKQRFFFIISYPNSTSRVIR